MCSLKNECFVLLNYNNAKVSWTGFKTSPRLNEMFGVIEKQPALTYYNIYTVRASVFVLHSYALFKNDLNVI